MTKIRTYQLRRCRSGPDSSDVEIEHCFEDEPSTMATATMNIMMLARELEVPLSDVLAAMKLLP